MFGLTLVDHLRLTFGHVIYTHRGHAQLALRYAQWSRGLLCGEAVAAVAAVAAAIGLAQTGNGVYAIGTALAAGATLIVLIVRLVLDLDRTAATHRVCSAHLWHLREQYRALLADLQDGSITLDAARDRRDDLMKRLHDVYENAPPLDRKGYTAAREALPTKYDAAMTDEEVDRFLPESLKKTGKPAA
jgi:SMODS and SLOG-associating 2TM effector domain family 4